MPAEPASQEPQKAAEPKGQVFNLKPAETQTLVIVRNNQQAEFAAILNLIAVERFGYQPTEHTQFKLDAQMSTIEISELPPQVPVAAAPAPANTEPNTPQPPQPPAEPQTPPKSPVVPAQ